MPDKKNAIRRELESLNRQELDIFARRLGIETEPDQKAPELVESILEHPKCKTIEKDLDIAFLLKPLDQKVLAVIARRLGAEYHSNHAKLIENILGQPDRVRIMRELDIISRLKSLEEGDLDILGTRLGIELKFANYTKWLGKIQNLFSRFRSPQKRAVIAKHILNDPKHRNTARELLDIIQKLKGMGAHRLKNLARDVGISGISSNDKAEIIQHIVSHAEYKKLGKKLGVGIEKEYSNWLHRMHIVVLFIALFYLLRMQSGLIWTILGSGSAVVAIIALMLSFDTQSTNWRERVATSWKTNRILLTAILLPPIFYFFPSHKRGDLLTYVGGAAGLIGFMIFACNTYLKWDLKKYINMACFFTITAQILSLIYIVCFIISGTVKYDGTALTSGKIAINFLNTQSSKSKQELKETEIKEGKFIFYIHSKQILPISLEKEKKITFSIKYKKQEITRDVQIDSWYGMKNIKIDIKQLDGEWCYEINGVGERWVIRQKDDNNLIIFVGKDRFTGKYNKDAKFFSYKRFDKDESEETGEGFISYNKIEGKYTVDGGDIEIPFSLQRGDCPNSDASKN